MEPGRTAYWCENFSIVPVLLTPSGKSQSTCNAKVGQTPVSKCTWPASLNFSSIVVAAAGWTNFPKRVPVFANPQEGISIRNASKARNTFSVSCDFITKPFSGNGAYTSDAPKVTCLLG